MVFCPILELINFFSNSEYDELSSALNMVQDLVQRQGVPVFSEINHALNCTAKVYFFLFIFKIFMILKSLI